MVVRGLVAVVAVVAAEPAQVGPAAVLVRHMAGQQELARLELRNLPAARALEAAKVLTARPSGVVVPGLLPGPGWRPGFAALTVGLRPLIYRIPAGRYLYN